jgi:molecular chaperone GrpE
MDEMIDETSTSDTTRPAGEGAPADAAAPDAAQGATSAAAAPQEAQPAEAGPTVEALQAEVAAMRDRMLRAVADADNTRKRAEREAAEARAYAVANFARDLLSVSDNLSRALTALTPEVRNGMGEAASTVIDGVEITLRELHAALSRAGVKKISASPGTMFDPNLHQAAAQIPSIHPAGAIVEVFQDGWQIADRTLRAAVVAVSAGPAQTAQPGETVDTKA